MTRLEERDIDHVARQLEEYDARLKRVTTATLRQIASKAAGVDEAAIVDLQNHTRVAAVPISSGLGVIDGFSDTVAAIVSFVGFESFVTDRSDDDGIAEGIERGANILMFADDIEFVARDPGDQLLVDNSKATALGFVAGLELMKGGLAGDSVLVLGCGPVGVMAAEALIDCGAKVVVCDIDQERALAALRDIGEAASGRIRMERSSEIALEDYELIFDATNVGNFIESSHLTPQTIVAAPGMPCALTADAMGKHRDRVIHDPLEIGTATMAVQAAAGLARVEGATKTAER